MMSLCQNILYVSFEEVGSFQEPSGMQIHAEWGTIGIVIMLEILDHPFYQTLNIVTRPKSTDKPLEFSSKTFD